MKISLKEKESDITLIIIILCGWVSVLTFFCFPVIFYPGATLFDGLEKNPIFSVLCQGGAVIGIVTGIISLFRKKHYPKENHIEKIDGIWREPPIFIAYFPFTIVSILIVVWATLNGGIFKAFPLVFTPACMFIDLATPRVYYFIKHRIYDIEFTDINDEATIIEQILKERPKARKDMAMDIVEDRLIRKKYDIHSTKSPLPNAKVVWNNDYSAYEVVEINDISFNADAS